MGFRRLAVLLVLWAAATPAQDAGSPTDHLQEALYASPTLEKNLRVLCDEIGGRIPGTPAMAKAVTWATRAFREAGLSNVHTESFTIANSWAEGASRAEVVSPIRFPARVAAAGWSAATPNGGFETEVISAGRGDDGDVSRLGHAVRGKIVLLRTDLVSSFRDMATDQRRAAVSTREAEKQGAAAILLISDRPAGLLYRHTLVMDGRIDRMPVAVVAREEGLRMLRMLDAGQKVRMRLSLPNKTGGAFQSENVVAEIPGREKPGEVVIIGAHLDSWDLGTGCLDNGCNAAMVIDVARAIQATQPHPRRTVRFILFSGEEQGLLGSRAYVRQHRAELDNVVAVMVHDIGVGKISGYSMGGRRDTEDALTECLEPVAQRGVTRHTSDAFFGSDHFDFLLEGIPTLVANQDATDYVPNYHAQSDTFDKVDLSDLHNEAGIAAVAIYNIANRTERLGKRLNRAEMDTLLRDTRLDDQMKFLGLWASWESGERGRSTK